MVTMKKMKATFFLATLSIIFLLLIVLFYTPVITPDVNQFKLSKEERFKIVKKLEKECSFVDAMMLAINYKEILGDEETAKCWSRFANECERQKENNNSLKIPIECPFY